MDIKIAPLPLQGTVKAIPSKSQAHRALICAALADKPTHIECQGGSEDISATMDCLTALGAEISGQAGVHIVKPLPRGKSAEEAVLPCRESGSSLRFLLPLAGALGRKAAFIAQGRLPRRPLSPLYEELLAHGCRLSPPGSAPLRSEGQLRPGRYTLDGGVSSQFVSGLLFALPLLEGNSQLLLQGRMESLPYVEMTLAMLARFGIKIGFDGALFSIPGGQSYTSPEYLKVEGDWSNAAFWLGAGAIGTGTVSCLGLDLDSSQGDRAILDILSRFGARVEALGRLVRVSGGRLQGVEVDARDIPDLVPVLAVVAACAQGITLIGGAGRLRDKESDRLAAMSALLSGLGAEAEAREDSLLIRGGRGLSGGQVSSWGDHRIAMAAAVAASVCAKPVLLQGAEAVNKSYPRFFDDLRLLGGSARLL